MSLSRLVVTVVRIEGGTKAEVAVPTVASPSFMNERRLLEFLNSLIKSFIGILSFMGVPFLRSTFRGNRAAGIYWWKARSPRRFRPFSLNRSVRRVWVDVCHGIVRFL